MPAWVIDASKDGSSEDLRKRGEIKRSMKKIRKKLRNARRKENNRRTKYKIKQKNNRFSRWVTSLVLCQATLYLTSVASQRARLNIWVRWRCDKRAIYYDNMKWRNFRKDLPVLALLKERRQVSLSCENLNKRSPAFNTAGEKSSIGAGRAAAAVKIK